MRQRQRSAAATSLTSLRGRSHMRRRSWGACWVQAGTTRKHGEPVGCPLKCLPGAPDQLSEATAW